MLPSGYTAIETYINELADALACGSPPGDTDGGESGGVEGGGVEFLGVFVADLGQEDGDARPGLDVGGVVDEAEQGDEVAHVLALEALIANHGEERVRAVLAEAES